MELMSVIAGRPITVLHESSSRPGSLAVRGAAVAEEGNENGGSSIEGSNQHTPNDEKDEGDLMPGSGAISPTTTVPREQLSEGIEHLKAA